MVVLSKGSISDSLSPATRYYYRAWVSGKTPGPVGSFVTAPRAGKPSNGGRRNGPETRLGQQRLQPVHARQAGAGRRFQRRAANGSACANPVNST